MKVYSILLLFFCLTVLVYACAPHNLLLYKYRRYYSEEDYFLKDSIKTLIQSIQYDRPRVIDASFSQDLYFKIQDTRAVLAQKTIQLPADSAILTCEYDFSSVWNWEDEHYPISGTIRIVKWKARSITIKENIVVEDLANKERLLFKGKRRFRLHQK